MTFYQENKVNPAASCLPILVQIPIFISLFYVLRDFEKEVFPQYPGSELGWLGIVPNITDKVTSTGPGWLLLVLYVASQLASILSRRSRTRRSAGSSSRFRSSSSSSSSTELPGRADPLLGDDEPVDGRAGARDAAPDAETAPRRRSGARGRRPRSRRRRRPTARRRRRARPCSRPAGPPASSACAGGRRRAARAGDDRAGSRGAFRSKPRARPSARRSGPLSASSSGAFPGSTRASVQFAGALGGRARPPRRRVHARARDRSGFGRGPRPAVGRRGAGLARRAAPRAPRADRCRARRRRRVTIHEDEETLLATLTGPDLGLLIGKRGQTIDAIQYLANAIVWRGRRGAEERGRRRRGVPRPAPGVARAAGRRRRRRSARLRTGRDARADVGARAKDRPPLSAGARATSRRRARAPSPTAASSSRPVA